MAQWDCVLVGWSPEANQGHALWFIDPQEAMPLTAENRVSAGRTPTGASFKIPTSHVGEQCPKRRPASSIEHLTAYVFCPCPQPATARRQASEQLRNAVCVADTERMHLASSLDGKTVWCSNTESRPTMLAKVTCKREGSHMHCSLAQVEIPQGEGVACMQLHIYSEASYGGPALQAAACAHMCLHATH